MTEEKIVKFLVNYTVEVHQLLIDMQENGEDIGSAKGVEKLCEFRLKKREELRVLLVDELDRYGEILWNLIENKR